jgi:hypothetical protein
MIMKPLHWIVLLLPPLLGGLFIHFFGVNIVKYDEFHLIPILSCDHLPSLTNLLAQHNEHRILFPKVLYFFIAKATNFNTVAVMYASFIIVCFVYALFTYHIQNTYAKRLAFFASLIAGILLFHPMQSENILWGFQLSFYLTFAFSMLSIYFFTNFITVLNAQKNILKRSHLGLSILFCMLASFSSIQGLLCWPTVGCMWIVFERKKTFTTFYFYLWGAFATLTWMGYFYGYAKPPQHPSMLEIFNHPFNFTQYMVAWFGSPFRYKRFVHLQGALILFVGFFVCLHAVNHRSAKTLFPLGLIIFSFFTGMSISIGRSGFNWEQALSSRYTTFSLAFFLGILLYIFALYQEHFSLTKKIPIQYIQIILTLLMLMLLVRIPQDIKDSSGAHKVMIERQEYFRTFTEQPDKNLLLLDPNGDVTEMREGASVLKRLGYNVFCCTKNKESK